MKGRLTTAELAESDIDTVLIAGIDLYGRLIGKRVPTRIFLANIDEGLLAFTKAVTKLRTDHPTFRRRRFFDDECVECGHPITTWRGRCPGCGERIGPG